MFICLLAIIACAYASFGGGGGGGGGGLNIGALLQQVKQIWNSQLRYRKISWMHWYNFQRGQSKSFRNFRLFSISKGIEFCVTRKKNLTDIFPKKNYRTLIFEKMLLTSNGFWFFFLYVFEFDHWRTPKYTEENFRSYKPISKIRDFSFFLRCWFSTFELIKNRRFLCENDSDTTIKHYLFICCVRLITSNKYIWLEIGRSWRWWRWQ